MKTNINEWLVGATVTVGFMNGLHIHEKVPSPGNFRPDGYILSRGNSIYAFVPHYGIQHATSINEAREIIRQ